MMWLEAEFPMDEQLMDAFEGVLLLHGVEAWERTGGANVTQMGANYDYLDASVAAARSAVKIVLEDNEESRELLSALAAASGVLPVLRLQDERQWADEWKKFYHPLEIGRRLCVCPAWEVYEGQGRKLCLVEPGGVFGTGLHQTTQLCLQFLEERVHGGERVLDLGCGSGILGIASLCLGAAETLGVDIEPQAREAALHNAVLNGVSERFSISIGDVCADAGLVPQGAVYDIVIANIVADVIMALAPFAHAHLAEDGFFMVSGIIGQRLDEVKSCLTEQGFAIVEERFRDDWHALLLKKA